MGCKKADGSCCTGKPDAASSSVNGSGVARLVEMPNQKDACPGLLGHVREWAQCPTDAGIVIAVDAIAQISADRVDDHKCGTNLLDVTPQFIQAVWDRNRDDLASSGIPLEPMHSYSLHVCASSAQARLDRVCRVVLCTDQQNVPSLPSLVAARHGVSGRDPRCNVKADQALAALGVAIPDVDLSVNQTTQPQPPHSLFFNIGQESDPWFRRVRGTNLAKARNQLVDITVDRIRRDTPLGRTLHLIDKLSVLPPFPHIVDVIFKLLSANSLELIVLTPLFSK